MSPLATAVQSPLKPLRLVYTDVLFTLEAESYGAFQVFEIVFVPAHDLTGRVGELGYGAAVDRLQLDDDIQGLHAGII